MTCKHCKFCKAIKTLSGTKLTCTKHEGRRCSYKSIGCLGFKEKLK